MQDNQREAVLNYMAGIFDGEGTVGIIKGKPRKNNRCHEYNAAVGIGMTDRNTVESFKNMFSPNLKIYIERVPDRKLIYRWRIIGSNCVKNFLDTMIPFLKVKKQEAEIVRQFCVMKSGYRYKDRVRIKKNSYVSDEELRRREELYQKVKKLKLAEAPATTK